MNETLSNFTGIFIFIFVILVVWSVAWKGVALWKAARLSHKKWFIALLLLNTLGILEIFYVFFIAKKDEDKGIVV